MTLREDDVFQLRRAAVSLGADAEGRTASLDASCECILRQDGAQGASGGYQGEVWGDGQSEVRKVDSAEKRGDLQRAAERYEQDGWELRA